MLTIASLFSPENATSTSIIFDRGYESVWSWARGVEYQVNDRLSLRAGYEPRPSAVPGNKADVLAPLGDAKLYGLGAGYQWDKDTVIDVFTWVDEQGRLRQLQGARGRARGSRGDREQPHRL